MKKKTIVFGIIALLLISLAIAKTIIIDTEVEIDSEVADWFEGQNISVENLTVKEGKAAVEDIAYRHFRNMLEEKCYDVMNTRNLTKIELLIDEADNILS